MVRALRRLCAVGVESSFLVGGGLLGSQQLTAAGIMHETVPTLTDGAKQGPGLEVQTCRDDSAGAARAMVAAGVCCIIFSGGDGTATDIAEAIGESVPVIGVPSGVKMHSEIFARSPESAGLLLAQFLRGEGVIETVEVLDVGPAGATGVVGKLVAPVARTCLQGAKVTTPSTDSASVRGAIAHDLIAGSHENETWVLGPGTTTNAVAQALGFEGTLRGVDVRFPSGTEELDVDEARLYQIVTETRDVRLVLGVVGGQGFLLGRGNHEISTRVIDRIGEEKVFIIGSAAKIGALSPPQLLVDLGDECVEHPLEGYRKVLTGASQSTVLKVVNASSDTV